jgi:hypothetical protein
MIDENDNVVVHTNNTNVDTESHYENEYSTCCSRTGKTDARLINYASKFTVSILMLGFASIQLVRSHDCDPLVPFYTSLITFILGIWVKSDSAKKKPVNI